MTTTTLTSSCLPIFRTMLGNLKHFLTLAITDAAARGYDGKVLVAARLAPDMLPLKNQITIACDAAKLCLARVGGVDAPKFDDSEQTLEELQARIDATLAWLGTLPGNPYANVRQPIVHTLLWLRMIPDTIFILAGVMPIVAAMVWGLFHMRGLRAFEAGRKPAVEEVAAEKALPAFGD